MAPKLDPHAGAIDLERPADEVVRRILAYTPDPGAFTTFHGQRIGIRRASIAGGPGAEHGTLEIRDGVPYVGAGAGWVRLDEVRPAGKRSMSGAEWARGLHGLGASERVPS
jgi:methionyl-tRNA formyltransferase